MIGFKSFQEAEVLDPKFRSERAELVRQLAEKADPFIKRRLLELVGRYEGEERRPAPLNTPKDLQADGVHRTRPER